MVFKCISRFDHEAMKERLPCLVILTLLSLLGCGINTFVIYIFSRIKSVFKSANKFLVTLFLGQLISTVFVSPFRIHHIAVGLTTSNCHKTSINDYVNALILISCVSNGVISYDRYLQVALVHNYKNKMKGLFLYLLLLLPWVSVLVYLLSFLVGELVNYVVLILIALMLYVSITVNYTGLNRVLTQQIKNLKSSEQSRNARRRRNKKIISICMNVMAIEFTCSLPGMITLLCAFSVSVSNDKWEFWEINQAIIKDVSHIFFLLSACANPFAYLYSHRKFKHRVQKLWNRSRVTPSEAVTTSKRNQRCQSAHIQKSVTRKTTTTETEPNKKTDPQEIISPS